MRGPTVARSAEQLPDDGRSTRRRGRGFGSVLLAFVLGVLLAAAGALALVLLGVIDVDATGGDSPTPTATATAAADPASAEPAAAGDVPQACLETADYNDALTQALDEIALGARDQDARALEEALDAVQDARPRGEAASDECRAAAGGGSQSTDDADEGGSAEPTDEPTDEASAEPSARPTPGEPTPSATP